MVEIGKYVEFLDLIKTLYYVVGLPAHSIALKHTDVKVTAKAEGIKVLTGQDYTACTYKRIIDEVS